MDSNAGSKKGRTMRVASSDLHDVCSLGAFLTLDYFKLDLVTLCERLESIGVDCAVVNEHIRTAFAGNESKAFSVVEPLYSSVDSFHARVFLLDVFRGKFCAPLCGAGYVTRDSSAFDALERHMGLWWWRRDIGFTLDVCGSARGAAQRVASTISAYERENLSGIVCVWSWFAHTVLRYVERLFDLVGCNAGGVRLTRRRTTSSEKSAPSAVE